MSFVKLGPGNISSNSIQLHPKRSFVTSSMGTTGALKVIVNRSETQKDSVDMRAGLTGTNDPQTFSENTFEGRRGRIFDLLNDGTIDSRGDLALGRCILGTAQSYRLEI